MTRDSLQTHYSLSLHNWSIMVLFEGGNRWIQQTVSILLTYHNVTFLLIKKHYVPHLLVAFEASDIYREAFYKVFFFFLHLHL